MKYFFDTEFIEGFNGYRKTGFWGRYATPKPMHTIDLISIGIVAEDGREYYAISNEFNPKDADDWVRDNVLIKLPLKIVGQYDSPRQKQESLLWKSNKQIAKEIEQFCKPNETKAVNAGIDAIIGNIDPNIEFYGYYADYDWVLICSLFGRMIDLPKGFPMYCKDLKQMYDDVSVHKLCEDNRKHGLRLDPDYPKQENEHNALDDAKWNYELYKFLQNL